MMAMYMFTTWVFLMSTVTAFDYACVCPDGMNYDGKGHVSPFSSDTCDQTLSFAARGLPNCAALEQMLVKQGQNTYLSVVQGCCTGSPTPPFSYACVCPAGMNYDGNNHVPSTNATCGFTLWETAELGGVSNCPALQEELEKEGQDGAAIEQACCSGSPTPPFSFSCVCPAGMKYDGNNHVSSSDETCDEILVDAVKQSDVSNCTALEQVLVKEKGELSVVEACCE